MKPLLYEINDELTELVSMLEEVGIEDLDKQQALQAWLEGQSDVSAAMDDFCALIAERSAYVKVRKEEAKRLSAMAAHDEAVADAMKERAFAFFTKAGITKMKTEHFAPRIQLNGGVLPLILSDEVMHDPSILPGWAQKTVPDMEAIRAALEKPHAGTLLLVGQAKLGERGKHFRVS